MKIQVNFDLLSRIATAKTGFELDRTVKQIIKNTLIVETICLPLGIAADYTQEQFMAQLLRQLILQATILGTGDVILSKMQKERSIMQLKILSHTLNTIDIKTNYELLIQAYKYETNYKLDFNDSKIPQLIQQKYIMIPVYEDCEEKEISVLQEHIVGSESYDLSIGTPNYQKRLKLASNPI